MKRAVKKKKQRILNKLFAGGAIFAALQVLMPTKPISAMPTVAPAGMGPHDIANITSALTTDASGNRHFASANGIMEIVGNNGNAFIPWRDFSIAYGELVRFTNIQNILNYVVAVNPSLIYGSIDASNVDKFYLVNPNGIYFGPNSMVTTNNFIVSTRELTKDMIDNYISGGTLNLDNNPVIGGENWFNSKNVTGTYDVADGDIMFLGKVQADKVTVEGNTIQIRNTKNFTDKNGDTLSGDKMKFYTNNPVEVGYVVDVTDQNLSGAIEEPFTYVNAESTATEDAAIEALAKEYDIYIGTGDSAEVQALNAEIIATNKAELLKLYNYFDAHRPASSDDTQNKLLSLAMDKVIRKNISKKEVAISSPNTITTYNGAEVAGHVAESATLTECTYKKLNAFTYPTAFDADVQAALNELTTAYNNMISGDAGFKANYKYFIADKLGDKNMTGSGSNLQYTVKQLDHNTEGSIRDFRLIQNVNDLNLVNHSKYTLLDQFLPTEGVVHGNYMLDADLNLTGTFNPLGYAMTNNNFASESDQIHFNGLNFTINGLTTDTSLSKYQGLFSVFSGSIKNVRLTNVNVGTGTGGTAASPGASGALIGAIGEANTSGDPLELTSTIKNVSATGSVEGDNAGGLVGTTGTGDSEELSYKKTEFNITFEDGVTLENLVANAGGSGLILTYENAGSGESTSIVTGITTLSSTSPGNSRVTFSNIDNFVPTSATYNAGGILGYAKRGALTFSHIINSGDISSYGYAGGLLGSTGYDVTVNGFYTVANTGAITSSGTAGGLAGYIPDSIGGITGSYNIGNVKSTGYGNAAGFVGDGSVVGNIQYSFNTGDIESANGSAGGLISGSVTGNVTDSYNTGNITVSGSGQVGGLISSMVTGNIKNVYNSGNITGSANFMGGLVGKTINGNATNAYNLGDLENSYTTTKTSGIAGYKINGNAENVYNFGAIKLTDTGNYQNYASGITATFGANAILNKVYNFGDVSSASSIGIAAGISASASTTSSDADYYSFGENTKLTDVYNYGKIATTSTTTQNSKYKYASGIATRLNSKTELTRVYNYGDVEVATSSTGYGYAAGIANFAQKEDIVVSQVTNFGDVKGFTGASGIFYNANGQNMDLTYVYNVGDVTAKSYATGIANVFERGTKLTNIYNYGDITATGSSGKAFGIVYLLNNGYKDAQDRATLTDIYNFGTISTTGTGKIAAAGIAYGLVNADLTNIYNVGDVSAVSAKGDVSDIASTTYAASLTKNNVVNAGTISGGKTRTIRATVSTTVEELATQGISKNNAPDETDPDMLTLLNAMWDAFGANQDGSLTNDETPQSTVWRVYPNPDNPVDKTRQPLLTQYMHYAKVTRYSQLAADGSVEPYYLVDPSAYLGMHALHDSSGKALYVRYKNTGLSATTDDGTEYYLLNPANVQTQIIQSQSGAVNPMVQDSGAFNVSTNGTKMAKGLMYSGQFGYNFFFYNNIDAWDETNNTEADRGNITENPLTDPVANSIYLKVGNEDKVPGTPTIKKPIDETPSGGGGGGGDDSTPATTTIYFTITADSGMNYNNSGIVWNTTGSSGSGKHYTISNPTDANLDKFTFTSSDGTDGSTNKITVVYGVTGATTTTSGNVVTVVDGTTTYVITINQGTVGTSTNIPVTITVGKGTITDGVFTDEGYTVSNNVIGNLLGNGVLKVTPTNDGTGTTVTFGDAVTSSSYNEGTRTYTVVVGGNTYNFIRNLDGTYTYSPNNGTTNYQISINNGALNTITNRTVSIQVKSGKINSYGVFSVVSDSNNDNGFGYTVSNDSTNFIRNLIGNVAVTPSVTDADGKQHTTITLPSSFTPTAETNIYNYTRTSGNTTVNYRIRLVLGDVTVLTDTGGGGGGYTPAPTPTPDPEPETPAPTPTPSRVTPVTPTVEPDPEPTPVTPTPTPTPVVPVTPVVPTVEPTTPEPTQTTPVITVPEDVTTPENLDPHLDNSDMQTFNFENGDYIDLDLQDHFLVDSFNADEKVNTLGDNPGEFATAMDRNQVDNHIDLTSITETNGTGDVGEIGGGNGGGLIGFQNLSGDNGGQSSEGGQSGQTGGLSGAVGGNNGGDSSGEGEGGNQPSVGKDESQGVDQSGVNGKAADGNKTSDSGKTSGSDKKSGTDKKSDSNDKGDSENSDSDDEDKDKDNGEGEGEEQK